MLWAAALGILMGAGDVPALVAAFVLFGGVAAKGSAEVVRFTRWGAETPYASYVQNLRVSGSLPARPWVGYLAQMLLWGGLIGGALYLVARRLW